MARGSDGESVLHMHLRVLQAFDVLRPFLTLTEIVETTGLAVSTTHRLVAELEREGLLERMPGPPAAEPDPGSATQATPAVRQPP